MAELSDLDFSLHDIAQKCYMYMYIQLVKGYVNIYSYLIVISGYLVICNKAGVEQKRCRGLV